MTASTLFPQDYLQSRQDFCKAAERAGALITSYDNAAVRSDLTQTLASDVAWLGQEDAGNVLVQLSGVHGVEGAAGAAAQIASLNHVATHPLPADTAMLWVHAVNPWGYVHQSRFNENNVDLNRNFVDHRQDYPPNPDYADFHDIIAVSDLSPRTLAAARTATRDLAQRLGRIPSRIAMNGGQAAFPDGTSFAGTEAQWSHSMLRNVVTRHLGKAQRIGLTDWHTGYGRYGEVTILSRGEMRQRAMAWFDREYFNPKAQDAGAAWSQPVNQYTDLKNGHKRRDLAPGQFRDLLPDLCPQAEVTAVTVEFGSIRQRSDWLTGRIYERWLHKHGAHQAPESKPLRDHIAQLFVPDDPAWQHRVARKAVTLTKQAIAGLLQSPQQEG